MNRIPFLIAATLAVGFAANLTACGDNAPNNDPQDDTDVDQADADVAGLDAETDTEDEDDADAEPDVVDADTDSDVDTICCPISDRLNCSCNLHGGSRDENGQCGGCVADEPPVGTLSEDENGCPIWIDLDPGSCIGNDVGRDPDADIDADIDTSDDPDTDLDAEDTDTTEDPDTTDVEDTDTSEPVWTVPDCPGFRGAPTITMTTDDGASVLPSFGSTADFQYTYGLVVLPDVPNTLVANTDNVIVRSTDGGCTFREIGDTEGGIFVLAAARGDRAYGWTDNNNGLLRVDGETVIPLTSPVDSILGLAAHPTELDWVRLGDKTGAIWQSQDAGETWETVFRGPPGGGPLGYRVAFDPNDWDHALYGQAGSGAWVTFDGAETWTQASGTTEDGGRSNIFNMVVSPADSNVVYAQGIDITEELGDPDSDGRYVFRSDDGGLSFIKIQPQTDEIVLTNGPVLAAHPTNAEVLYFGFGTCFSGYGADLYRYDHSARATTINNIPSLNEYGSYAFNPADPTAIYIGINAEGFALCD